MTDTPFLPDPADTESLEIPSLQLATNGRRRSATQGGGVDEPHLRDYLRIVVKRRHIALVAFVVVALVAVVYAFTTTPVYEGRVQLLIEADNPNVVSFKEVIDEEQNRQDYYQTQYKLLESRSLAKKTIDTLQLWNNPELAPVAGQQKFSIGNAMRGGVAWVASLFGSSKTPAAAPGADETIAQSKTIDAFLDRLTVSPVRNSRLVEVSYRSADPMLAPNVANAIGKAFIEQNLDFRFTATREASDWLNQQLASQKTQLEKAEAKLQQYREANGAISLEDRQNIVVQKLADLNGAVTRAKTDRLQKEAVYRQIAAIQNDPAQLDTFPAILMNQFIQQQKSQVASLQQQKAQLADKLGDRHPDMIKLDSAIQEAQAGLQREIAKVVQAVRAEYQAALAQEQSLTTALDAQKGEAMEMNNKAIDYGVLDRDVQSNKQIYDSLLQRAKETGISGDLKTSNVRVVDNAEPSNAPVSPKRGLDILLGLFGGAFIGIGLAFFFEYLDNRVKTPEEIEVQLGLPSLGMIPMLSAKDHPSPLINNGVPANFAEAFRGLRTNVLFSSTEDGSRSIVVTSTAPGEGKTMVASNLAVGIAQAGLRVLIIDADMRRPRAHEMFGRDTEPGLSNLLVGAAKASEVVTKTTIPNLWFVPAGKTPPNPAELLGSKRFHDMLESMKPHFDYIVIDTPPVMAVTDATIAAHRASGVLFVIAADVTTRQGAEAALDQLDHGRARFIGAVLNRVDLERDAYYYSRYYRKEYKNYYVAAAH
jgi:capsular exopolysaccharide synthesis family protein